MTLDLLRRFAEPKGTHAMFKSYGAPGAIPRLQGESWADFTARQQAHRTAAMKPKRVRKPRAKKTDRTADRIDGYDRDDIGLSHD